MADSDYQARLRDAIIASAGRIGISPSDLATAISYETAGTFDPWKRGPRTQWGTHRGLIQWGEPQAKRYGVYAGMPVEDQLRSVEKYLTDSGVKSGMGLLDVYSAINAGRVGRYGASDANNGGAPGTVADKVATMAGHRIRANRLLGLDDSGPLDMPIPRGASAVAGAADRTVKPADLPMSLAGPSSGAGDLGSAVAGLQALAKAFGGGGQTQFAAPAAPPPIQYAIPAGLAPQVIAALRQRQMMG